MSTGLLDCLLNDQSKTAIPAGQKMQVVMISREHLIRNPDNQIYIIGDVSRLKEDIKTNGIRQPLEVVDLEDGNFKLIGGERRLTACEELAAEGEPGYEMLPCVVRKSKDPDDDKIALITANATARDLTDGERLAQYEALKGILSRRKKNGQLKGKVRDELCRILGLSAGAAARLNAISENCSLEARQQLRDGELSLMGAYRCAQAEIACKSCGDTETAKIIKKNPQILEPPETVPGKPVESPYQKPEPEKPKKEEPAKPEEKKPWDPARRRTMLTLAEKELGNGAGWAFNQGLCMLRLDFYVHPLPGGAKLWRMNDQQRDAMGLAPGDHVRYAIILQDGKFFTTGWELYNEAVESLIKYLDLS